jgi:hypothetical protein
MKGEDVTFSLKHGLYAHPFEAVACVSSFLSIYGTFQLLLYHPEILDNATSGILTCPRWMLWTWVVTGFIGAVLTGFGLTASIFSQKGRTVEETGLWLMGAMWLSAGFARSLLDLNAWVEYVRYFAIAAGCVVRLMQLNDFHEFVKRGWRETQSR